MWRIDANAVDMVLLSNNFFHCNHQPVEAINDSERRWNANTKHPSNDIKVSRKIDIY